MTTPKRALEAPTQVQHPWRATLRTGVAVLLGLAVVLPAIWAIIGDELAMAGWVIPEPVSVVVATVIAAVVAAASIITRIMAIPQVSDWLTKVGLGPAPQGGSEGEPTEPVIGHSEV